jgi:hypothetical protein
LKLKAKPKHRPSKYKNSHPETTSMHHTELSQFTKDQKLRHCSASNQKKQNDILANYHHDVSTRTESPSSLQKQPPRRNIDIADGTDKACLQKEEQQ